VPVHFLSEHPEDQAGEQRQHEGRANRERKLFTSPFNRDVAGHASQSQPAKPWIQRAQYQQRDRKRQKPLKHGRILTKSQRLIIPARFLRSIRIRTCHADCLAGVVLDRLVYLEHAERPQGLDHARRACSSLQSASNRHR